MNLINFLFEWELIEELQLTGAEFMHDPELTSNSMHFNVNVIWAEHT